MFFPIDGISASQGMGLATVGTTAVLWIPLVEGLLVCVPSQNPPLSFLIPYSAIEGYGTYLPTTVALLAPYQSLDTQTLYFPWFDGANPGGGMGFISVSQTNLTDAIALKSLLNTQIPLNPLLPITGAWCVHGTGTGTSAQDTIYVAVPGWANATTAQWSLQIVDPANGTVMTLAVDQPGQPWGLCFTTVTV